MTNARSKGARGELMAAKLLQSFGFKDARRSQQYCGLATSDVSCPESLPNVHIEVKFRQDSQPGTKGFHYITEQLKHDCGLKAGVVLFRQTHQPWRIAVRGLDLGIAFDAYCVFEEDSIKRVLELIQQRAEPTKLITGKGI